MSLELIRADFDDGRLEDAARRTLELARSESQYSNFLSLCRWRRRLQKAGAWPEPSTRLRLALLGGATTDLLEEPLALMLESRGLGCDLYAAPYNTFALEMLSPSSELIEFAPQVAMVVTTPANQLEWPQVGDDLESVRALVSRSCDSWLSLCNSLHEQVGCEVLINNFHALDTRALGNLGSKLAWDPDNFLRRLNLELGDHAPSHVYLNDVAGLAARLGGRLWFDPRYWFHAKQPVSFECLVPYVRNTVRMLAAMLGHTAKCLVLDLDNTLWGGVVGDDGSDGIAIGAGDPTGEAHLALQQYALDLKARGVLLAVCSKNEEANALAPFQSRKEMALRRDDFVAFRANWDPKPDNLRAIAAELDIGLDSLVFVDDNPAERDHVRQRLPEVKVVELGDDPSQYARLVDESGWFETTSISREDRERTAQYRRRADRVTLEESASDYTSYLKALEQRAVFRPFEASDLARITQLVNKTNQFNLTTLRLTSSQVEALADDPDVFACTVRMADRFGDNGLISVFAARRDGDEFSIDLWLMSCRVLKRGVEQLLCTHVVEGLRRQGAKALRGRYLPTARNQLVREHYAQLGFEKLGEGDDGSTEWRLQLDAYDPGEVTIEIVDSL